ncbi:hypothetical protein UF75_1915 [Desulfosporosinus sp. I2]|nr:hypothetical protein UF75_1915 [Desulfosporosinus sp. I2]
MGCFLIFSVIGPSVLVWLVAIGEIFTFWESPLVLLRLLHCIPPLMLEYI